MKWIKRLFVLVLVLAVVAGGVAGYGYWMSGRLPKWYRPKMTSEQFEAAANKASSKLSAVINFADPVNPRPGDPSTTAATTGPDARSITFTQDELNAFILRWADRDREEYEKFIGDPQFTLKEGQIIFSGHVKQLDKFCSLFLEPSIDDKGDLHLEIASIQAGMLPIPESMVSKYVNKWVATLQDWIPAWQKSAELDARGADKSAMKAAMSELLLHTLRHEPAAPLLFIGRIGESRSVPVKLTDVTVAEGSITLSIKRMDAAERAAALERIKQPLTTATSGGVVKK